MNNRNRFSWSKNKTALSRNSLQLSEEKMLRSEEKRSSWKVTYSIFRTTCCFSIKELVPLKSIFLAVQNALITTDESKRIDWNISRALDQRPKRQFSQRPVKQRLKAQINHQQLLKRVILGEKIEQKAII